MFIIDSGVWSSMELKRTGLTCIRKGRLRSSSYSSCCHLPFHLSLLQNSRAVANAKGSCSTREYQVFSFNYSSKMMMLSMGRASCFGGKEQPIIWELAISSAEKWPSFLLMISDQLYAAINVSELSFYHIFTRFVRELPRPRLQRSDIFRMLVPLFFLRRDIWPNRFSVLCQTCCQDRSPYKCSDLKTGVYLWFGGILSDTLDSTSP